MAIAVRGSLQLGTRAYSRRRATLLAVCNRLLGLRLLDALYQQIRPGLAPVEFLAAARAQLRLDCEYRGRPLTEIPTHGSLVIVSNHPFGGADTLLLTELLLRRRADLRVLANGELQRIDELREILLPLDIFGRAQHDSLRNRRSLRAAARWLEQGGAVLLFPAGEVSHLGRRGRIMERRWDSLAGWLVRRSAAAVIPTCFEGRNPWWFHVAGALHPLLRSVLLPRVLLKHRGQRFILHLGARIPFGRIENLSCAQSTSDFLRAVTLQLPAQGKLPDVPVSRVTAALAEPVNPQLLAAEIETLGPTHQLLRSRSLQVYLAAAAQIPWLLREIGRLRELTFRSVGEGTGQALDLDRFDQHYLHLFIWDKSAARLVGAYRLGLVDEITKHHGREGLYTYSLFRYSRRMLTQLGPAIELGRSFIVPDYQKSFAPLLLLWRGIGSFVARHPHYRTLFGPVSISAHYQPASRRCIVRYLRRHAYDRQLARQVRARTPYRSWPLPGERDGLWSEVRSISDLELFSNLLSFTEHDGKGVPVLLRHYLRLGGRVVGFNVDRNFGNALDGLIVVDLPRTPGATLNRYMGADEASRYLGAHRDRDAAAKLVA